MAQLSRIARTRQHAATLQHRMLIVGVRNIINIIIDPSHRWFPTAQPQGHCKGIPAICPWQGILDT